MQYTVEVITLTGTIEIECESITDAGAEIIHLSERLKGHVEYRIKPSFRKIDRTRMTASEFTRVLGGK